MQLSPVIQRAIDLIYPAHCPGCNTNTLNEGALCAPCWSDVCFISAPHCRLCGAPLAGTADLPDAPCDECLRIARPWSRGAAAFTYEGIGRKIVMALKHGDRLDLAPMAARWMFDAGRDLLQGNVLLAPVPLHWRRLAQRRYNQSAVLAKGVARMGGVQYCPDLLLRTRPTPPLDHLSQEAREKALSDAIEVNPVRRNALRDRSLLIVDDVFTTGTTLAAATKAAQAAGAGDVCVLTLARAVMREQCPVQSRELPLRG